MDIRTRADYDHGPNEVFAVLTDPDFVAATVNQMSVGGQSHQVTTRGDHTVVTTRRTLPTDDLPDVAKKFAGPVLILDEVQDWGPAGPDGARHGTVTLRIDGVPVALTGTIALTPSAKGATQEVRADLKAKVPLIGGTIEKAAAPAIIAGIDAVAEMAKERLHG